MTPSAASQSLRNYLEYSRIGFVNILAFRLRYYTGVATYLINVTVYYFIWKALYATDAEFARGFSFEDMVTYVAVGWVIRSVYFNNVDQNMASDVMEGTIALSMLKPVTIQARYIGQALGEAGFRLLLLTAPTALVITLIFPRSAAGRQGLLSAVSRLPCRQCLSDGGAQLLDRNFGRSLEVDPGAAAGQVLRPGIAFRPPRSDDDVPSRRANRSFLPSLPAHRLHAAENLSGEVELRRGSRSAVRPIGLAAGTGDSRRLVLEGDVPQDHDSRRLAPG